MIKSIITMSVLTSFLLILFKSQSKWLPFVYSDEYINWLNESNKTKECIEPFEEGLNNRLKELKVLPINIENNNEFDLLIDDAVKGNIICGGIEKPPDRKYIWDKKSNQFR